MSKTQVGLDRAGNPTEVPYSGDAIYDIRGPAILAVGSLAEGFKFCGPFESVDAAVKFHEAKTLRGVLGFSASVFLLDKPEADAAIARAEAAK